MPHKQESDTENREMRENRSPTRAKVKKTSSFKNFSNILFTKYRKSHTINGATEAGVTEETEVGANKRQKSSILRRPSFRKLIRKITHQVTNVRILCTAYVCVYAYFYTTFIC